MLAVWTEVAKVQDRDTVITFEEAKERLGIKPMTNEKYIHSLNTEQLAEWIASVVQKAIAIKENNGIVMLESAIWWEEWLKQPHTFE